LQAIRSGNPPALDVTVETGGQSLNSAGGRLRKVEVWFGFVRQKHGRRYLYRNRRVSGKLVKEYVAADDRFGFGAVMADDLRRLQRRQARAEYRARIDALLADDVR
jgi:hypothetical protein